jgi:hypothetical protein
LRGLESAAISWEANGRGYDFIGHAGRRLRNARQLMQFADFREHINSYSTVKGYLKAATRAGRGWQIATWYTVGFVGIVITDFVVLNYTVSLQNYPEILRIQFFSMSVAIALVVLPLAICLIYLCASLRQLTLRRGYNSDLIVFTLAVIASLGVIIWPILLAGGNLFEQVGRFVLLGAKTQVEQNPSLKEFGQGYDLTSFSTKTIGETYLASILPGAGMIFPVSWVSIQLFALVTIPLKILFHPQLWWLGARLKQYRTAIFRGGSPQSRDVKDTADFGPLRRAGRS